MRTASILFVATLFVASAHASGLKSTIISMNKKVSATLVKGDLKAFEKITRAGVTKDFVYSENGQNMTYDQMLKQMKDGMGQMGKIVSAESKLVKLDIKGNTASGVCSHTMKTITKGKDKKNHVMVMTGKSVDTYVKVGDTWKMSKMAWTNAKMTMDGKPYDPSKMTAPPSKTTGR